MHIKHSANLLEFLKTVNSCESDVLFTTKDGDVLNLKSELSRYVFAALTPNTELLYSAVIICKDDRDYIRLEEYLTNSQED